jgi:hypothetical protein
MNFTQSFEEFSKGLGTTDLVLYAGVGLLIWILFKDKLSPVQNLLGGLLNRLKDFASTTNTKTESFVVKPKEPTTVTVAVATPVLVETIKQQSDEDKFFKLIVSWKQTRDLAEQCGCGNAVEVADSMFPYLSPNVCGKDNNND